jgi:ribosomal protein L37AE/L43A
LGKRARYKSISFEQSQDIPRENMLTAAKKTRWYLRPITWLLSFPEVKLLYRTKIHKEAMKGFKAPYLVLCNHNSFIDFKVLTIATFPSRVNYIVALDGFISRNWLLRMVGGVCCRKFINDLIVIKQIQHCITVNRCITALYPEARYSLTGTTSIIPSSVSKLIKLFELNTASLVCHGNHLLRPAWAKHTRHEVRLEAVFSPICTKEEAHTLSADEIDRRIQKAMHYDDYQYQEDKMLKIKHKRRAEGIEKVLYQCPHCKAESSIRSKGATITCEACGKQWEMTEYGKIVALQGDTEFARIPDWYEWQHNNVRQEIAAGKYSLCEEVMVENLINSNGFYRLGKGTLTHSSKGFELRLHTTGDTPVFTRAAGENYSIHIEFEYFGKGDAIVISDRDNSYYLYPVSKKVSVTKVHFAVEELFKLQANKMILPLETIAQII